MTSPAVTRWVGLLSSRAGMTAEEIAARHRDLLAFCAKHRVCPDALLDSWLDYPELAVRRRPDAAIAPNLAVESFLIHNGINVFGDIVCVAGQPEDLARQGAWFVAPDASRSGGS